MSFSISSLILFDKSLEEIPDVKLLINTINAHSYNTAQGDSLFSEAILNSDILLPDGVGIVFAAKLIKGKSLKKIAGADLFFYEMNKLNRQGGKCFFLGSDDASLQIIKERAKYEYPNVNVFAFSPNFKPAFSEEENKEMIDEINKCKPDVLFIGMTAPKQEKWAYEHFEKLEVGHVCCIGAVFDFYSMRVKRAPQSFIDLGLEWFFRLIKEPRRMWHRYLVGNPKFLFYVIKEKYSSSNQG